jgi:hypothetical protein
MPTEIRVRLPKLHPGQRRVHDSTARHRIVMCARRFGKTMLGVNETCETALDGKWVGWFSPTYKYALNAWRDIVVRLRPVAQDVSEQEKRIALITGGIVEVWTTDNPDAGRSRAYDLAVVDEAGLIRNGLTAIWQHAIRPTLTDRAGRALFLGSPKGVSSEFCAMYRKAEAPTWAAFTGATLENPYIDPAEIEAARHELPAEVFAQEYEGIPSEDGGNPFGLQHIAACTVRDPTALARLQALKPRAFGWDFARSQDYTEGVGLAKDYEVCRHHRWQGVPWPEQLARIHQLTGAVPAWGDSTRSRVDDVIVQDLQRMGTPIQGVAFSASIRQALLERLQVCMHQHKLQIPDGPLVRQLESFGYTYTAAGVKYAAPEDEHDDGVMALALAVYGRDQMGVIPDAGRVWHPDHDTHPGLNLVSGKRFRPRAGMAGQDAPEPPTFVPRGPLRPV